MSTDNDSQMNLAAVTDAKSLYDNLVREQYSGAEKRAALEMCVIKDSLDSLEVRPGGFHTMSILPIV